MIFVEVFILHRQESYTISFKMHYKGIARCNKFITTCRIHGFDEAKKRRMLAEVKSVKGQPLYAFKHDFWGRPLITEPQTVINANVLKHPGKVLFLL